jgi:hypothetical protein
MEQYTNYKSGSVGPRLKQGRWKLGDFISPIDMAGPLTKLDPA